MKESFVAVTQQPEMPAPGDENSSLDRRRFLKQAGLAAAAIGFPSLAVAPAAAQDEGAAFLAQLGKDKRLIVHNTRPGVLGTPLELLRQHRLTPKELLFIRNNQVLPGALTLKPLSSNGWTVELSGLIDQPRTVAFADIARLEQIEVEAVLQCSGNGRSFYARSVKTRGTQWAHGGMGNVRWKGVPLAKLLESLQLKIDPKTKFLAAEGKDGPVSPQAPDFEHSVPLGDALENGLLAIEMNGEPIPVLHGGPLRLVLPGYYGTMNIKWLHKLRFEAEESQNRHHIQRYRAFVKAVEPGSAQPITADTSLPTWRQKIKTVIWKPTAGEAVTSGPVEVSGVAWNDGGVVIAAVEVSTDRGRTWRRADVEKPSGPYAWHHWNIKIAIAGGSGEIWARSIDAMGQGQPADGAVHWNPSGYEWYGVDKVTLG